MLFVMLIESLLHVHTDCINVLLLVILTFVGKRGLGGFIFNMTELSPARYAIEITLNKGEYDELVFIKGFKVFADPMTCGVFLTEGISYDSVQGLQVNFGYSGMVGMFESVSCQLNDDPPTACKSRVWTDNPHTSCHNSCVLDNPTVLVIVGQSE